MQLPACQISNPDSGASSGGLTPEQVASARLGLWPFRISRLNANELVMQALGGDGVVPDQNAGTGTVVTAEDGDAVGSDISTQEAMDSSGGATGSAVAASASTVFAVYYCATGDFAGGLGFSTTAPTRLGPSLLLTLGAGQQDKLFLGWIRTSAAGALIDTVQDRHVVNYWNRRPTRLEVVPNYNNNNAATTYSRSSTSWVTMAATAAASQVSYISNGEDAAWFAATLCLLQGDDLGGAYVGIGLSTTTPLAAASLPATTQNNPSCSCAVSTLGSFGVLATPTMLVRMDSAVPSWTIFADFGRFGAAADVPATFMHGWIMA